MTTWTDATDASVTYSASLVSDGYVVAGYIVGDYISDLSVWADVAADSTVWA